MAGPLYELFYWRFYADQGIQVNMLFDREYSFRSYIGSFIEVKDNPNEYLDLQEALRSQSPLNVFTWNSRNFIMF